MERTAEPTNFFSYGLAVRWAATSRMMSIERILVPIDFSQPSLRALDDAVEFSRPYEARLTILYVVERGLYRITVLGYGSQSAGRKGKKGSRKETCTACATNKEARDRVQHARAVRRGLCRNSRDSKTNQSGPHHSIDPRSNGPGACFHRERRGACRARSNVSSAYRSKYCTSPR